MEGMDLLICIPTVGPVNQSDEADLNQPSNENRRVTITFLSCSNRVNDAREIP